MNIIILNDYGYIDGGASEVAIRTAIYLAEQPGIEVTFFCGMGPVCSELRESKIHEIIHLNQVDILNNPNRLEAIALGIYNPISAKRLKSFLNERSHTNTIVIVHTWTKVLSSSIFKVLKETQVKTFITLHDYFMICPNGGLYNYQENTVCKLTPLSFQCLKCNCDSRSYLQKLWRCGRSFMQRKNLKNNKFTYITISDFSRKILEQNSFKLNKHILISDPVDFSNERVHIQSEKNQEYLFVGRVCKEKGVSLFCKVITSLNLSGTVIGHGNLHDELKLEYPNIKFLGWKNHDFIIKYMENVRCLLFTSLWYETFGLTVAEALANGIPCIVPEQNAASELITNNKNGILYKMGDLLDLEEKIKKTFDDDFVKELSISAFESFDKKQYDIKTYTTKLLNIIKQ